jgi:hypothetical protein
MSDPTPFQYGKMPDCMIATKPVRVWFRPYSHDDVQNLLQKVCLDFGRPGRRWRYRSPDLGEQEQNVWCLDFYFANPHDATLFGLKYLK